MNKNNILQKIKYLIPIFILLTSMISALAADDNQTINPDQFKEKIDAILESDEGGIIGTINQIMDYYLPMFIRYSFLAGLLYSIVAWIWYQGKDDPIKRNRYAMMIVIMFIGMFSHEILLWVTQILYSLVRILYGVG